jgi:hypothetical protein
VKGKLLAAESGGLTSQEQQVLLNAAQRLLQLSLQCAASAAAAPAAAEAAAAVQIGQLRISSFSSNYLTSPAVLAALPAATLTKLDIDLFPPVNAPGIAAALAQLTNLRDMRLACLEPSHSAVMPAGVLAGLSSMQQLTSLQLHTSFSVAEQLQQLLSGRRQQQQLPLQRLTLEDLLVNRQQPQPQQQVLPLLQRLSLCFAAGSQLQPKLLMSGLTFLTELHIGSCSALAPGSSLPMQLRKLVLEAGSEANLTNPKLTALQKLGHLAITVCEGVSVASLKSLLQLQHLQSLALTYSCGTEAAVTAAAWQQLPQLLELRIDFTVNACSCQEFAGVTAGIAAAVSLTKLQLDL